MVIRFVVKNTAECLKEQFTQNVPFNIQSLSSYFHTKGKSGKVY